MERQSFFQSYAGNIHYGDSHGTPPSFNTYYSSADQRIFSPCRDFFYYMDICSAYLLDGNQHRHVENSPAQINGFGNVFQTKSYRLSFFCFITALRALHFYFMDIAFCSCISNRNCRLRRMQKAPKKDNFPKFSYLLDMLVFSVDNIYLFKRKSPKLHLVF